MKPPPHTGPEFTDDPTAELTASLQREQTYAALGTRTWNDLPLHPWSMARDSLPSRLIALDLPGHDLADLPLIRERYAELCAKNPAAPPIESLLDFGLYLGSAAKLLSLAAHAPEDFDALRSKPARFLREIEDWSVENITPDQTPAACLLAAEIRTAWRQFRPIPRPSRAGSDDSGN